MDKLTHGSFFSSVAFACALAAAIILVVFLIRRPILDRTVKFWLLLGMGVFPIGAALATNVEGYHATQTRAFCGSCHVMLPQAGPSKEPNGKGLAARHARNAAFGKESCYQCHADYGMYGTLFTKLGGMRHVWLYYTKFRTMTLEEAAPEVHLLKPFPNQNCMHCHSTETPGWQKAPDHRSAVAQLRSGAVSCASTGCHGFAHPQTKPDAGTPADLRGSILDEKERTLEDAGPREPPGAAKGSH